MPAPALVSRGTQPRARASGAAQAARRSTSRICPQAQALIQRSNGPRFTTPPSQCEASEPQYTLGLFCAALDPSAGCGGSYDPICAADLFECGLGGLPRAFCGPLPSSDGAECCFLIAGACAIGRPFVVGNTWRTGALIPGAGFADEIVLDLGPLSPAARRALANAYQKDATTEHASVAAFARFPLQCLALGAPLELVSAANQAVADEIEHARTCAGLARAYGGAELVPGPLDTSGALDAPPDLGDVAETVSALLLFDASRATKNPTVQALLARMAEDEVRHALLGFRFVRWAIGRGGPEVRERVAKVFCEAHRAVGLGARTEFPAPEAELREHGYLPVQERRAIAARALFEVVAPCGRVMIGSPTGAPPSSS